MEATVVSESAQIRIGCSGWQYKRWREIFYPKGLPQTRWFAFYAEHFDTVEINSSFYHLHPFPRRDRQILGPLFGRAPVVVGRLDWGSGAVGTIRLVLNNDIRGHALHDAQTLKSMIGQLSR